MVVLWLWVRKCPMDLLSLFLWMLSVWQSCHIQESSHFGPSWFPSRFSHFRRSRFGPNPKLQYLWNFRPTRAFLDPFYFYSSSVSEFLPVFTIFMPRHFQWGRAGGGEGWLLSVPYVTQMVSVRYHLKGLVYWLKFYTQVYNYKM